MQLSENHPDTLKHLLMMRLGYVYVPPNHLRVICQDGIFYGYLTTGYHWPRLWSLSYPQEIKISGRRCKTKLSKIRASDGGEFSAEVIVKYRFDPRNIEQEAQQANLSLAGDTVIEGIVKDALENGLRKAFSEYPAHTIQHGSMRNMLQRRCKHLLTAALKSVGIHISDVTLTTIEAPKAVERRANEAVSQMMAADYLRDVPQEMLLHLLVAQMPEILAKSDLSLDIKGTNDLTEAAKKLMERVSPADLQKQTNTQTGTQTKIMGDTRNGSSTLH